MDAATARHIGSVSVPNCRYIVFKDGYAYVSSYAGPVETDPNYRLGYVARIDTTTLQVKSREQLDNALKKIQKRSDVIEAYHSVN